MPPSLINFDKRGPENQVINFAWPNMINYTSSLIILLNMNAIGPTTSEKLHSLSEAGQMKNACQVIARAHMTL